MIKFSNYNNDSLLKRKEKESNIFLKKMMIIVQFRKITLKAILREIRLATTPGASLQGCPKVTPPNCCKESSPNISVRRLTERPNLCDFDLLQ